MKCIFYVFCFDHQGLWHRFSRDGTRPILVLIFIPTLFPPRRSCTRFQVARDIVVAVSPYKIRISFKIKKNIRKKGNRYAISRFRLFKPHQ